MTVSGSSAAPRPPRSAGPVRHHSVVVVIDDALVTSDAATFTYVDDPVISDVISRASILRCAM